MSSPAASDGSTLSSPAPSTSYAPSPTHEFTLEEPRPSFPPSIPALFIRRFLARELQQVGFESAERDVFEELEGIIFTLFESALIQAHGLANHSGRNRPHLTDIVESCIRLGVGGESELKDELIKSRDRTIEELPRLRYQKKARRASSSSPKGPTLASEDEDEQQDSHQNLIFNSTPAAIASNVQVGQSIATKRTLFAVQAEGLPKLPSKHSFKVTPAYPPPTLSAPFEPPPLTPHPNPQPLSPSALSHLATLRSRQNNSSQVASSLRNLIRRTSARPTEGPDSGLGTGEELDVVDYSNEWYSATSPMVNTDSRNSRGKTIWRLNGSTTEIDQAVLEESLGDKRVGTGLNGGGVVKRRRWRV